MASAASLHRDGSPSEIAKMVVVKAQLGRLNEAVAWKAHMNTEKSSVNLYGRGVKSKPEMWYFGMSAWREHRGGRGDLYVKGCDIASEGVLAWGKYE